MKIEPRPRKSKTEWEEIITNENRNMIPKYKSDGVFVYELFAVMIHSGGAYGGHYSAYIKDDET